ncbi:hypothetical protein [Scytonema sp. PCC 10023]|uniref:hypothetical protein n=1 Tax=Scytonema sp. PCC 10023 TaxID=1680591 RepID=UPI0039C6E50A
MAKPPVAYNLPWNFDRNPGVQSAQRTQPNALVRGQDSFDLTCAHFGMLLVHLGVHRGQRGES